MNKSINKVFDLINKTGDRCVVLSPDNDDVYVVMSLTEYERLALGKAQVSDLTEDELLDKINRDIAVWKSQQDEGRHEHIISDEISQQKSESFHNESDNLANTSQNHSEYSDFELEEDLEEEPYYFEKV